MKNDDSKMEIEQLADEDARAHLKETYADPEAAGGSSIRCSRHAESIDSLAKELNGDERLSETRETRSGS